jgi:hypothetical protein
MNTEQLSQLYEALESDQSGILVYETALRCVINEDLRKELTEYLQRTRQREQILRGVFEELHLDPEVETSVRAAVRDMDRSLVETMEQALNKGDAVTAQLVAVECVVEAELGRQRASSRELAFSR